MLADEDTTVPFWQLSLKSICEVIGGVAYVPFFPEAAVAPVLRFTRAQDVVLVVVHVSVQVSPEFTKRRGDFVRVIFGTGQLESAGMTAWQKPVQELKPLLLMPHEFVEAWHG